MPDRPNIVLIMTDQWRGDCLSVTGHPVVHTPYLDQMSLDGVRFDRAYSATPTCIPARAALFTGQTQSTHGRVGYRDGAPWNYEVTLAGELTRNGYQTQAVGKMHVYPERSQLGFQNVILHDGFLHYARRHAPGLDLIDDYVPWLRKELGRDADYFDHGVNCNSIVARPWDKPEYTHPTNWVVSQSVDFLRRRDPRKPFFLFMSFHRPHPPYDPPAWAFDQYLARTMPEPPVGDWVGLFERYNDPHNPECNVGAIDATALHRARSGYYGHMTHIDHQVNRFLESLYDWNLHENTYVLFTSDHGELLGDHHLFRKAHGYEGSARVPLILKGPFGDKVIRPRAVCREVVELRDVMPTILELAGLPIPESVEGRSFLPLARGESPQWREYLHGEHIVLGGAEHWLTDGHRKYLWHSSSGHEQLFDLDADPTELHDLASEPSADGLLSEWRARLVKELAGREEGFTDGARLIPGRPVNPVLSHLRRQLGGL